MLLKRDTMIVTACSFLILVCFYVSFNEYVFEYYQYLGFNKNQNIFLIFLSSSLFIIFFVSFKTNVERAMATLIYPATIFASPNFLTHFVLFAFFLTWLIIQFAFHSSDLSPKKKLQINRWIILTICLALIILYINIGQFSTGGFANTAELYEARVQRKDSMKSVEFLYENLVAKLVLPILGFSLLAYFKFPKIVLYFALVCCGILIFYLTTRKSLAVLMLLPILYPLFRASAVKFSSILVLGMITLTALSQILLYTPLNFVISTLLRRLFFTPAMVLEGYINYFTDHPYTLYGHTFLKFFDPLFIYIPPLVAVHSFGYDFNANTGAIGNAFAGFGLVGVVLISSFLSVSFKIFFSKSSDEIVYIPATLFFLSLVTNNDFYVLITAHGFIILFLLIFIRVK